MERLQVDDINGTFVDSFNDCSRWSTDEEEIYWEFLRKLFDNCLFDAFPNRQQIVGSFSNI